MNVKSAHQTLPPQVKPVQSKLPKSEVEALGIQQVDTVEFSAQESSPVTFIQSLKPNSDKMKKTAYIGLAMAGFGTVSMIADSLLGPGTGPLVSAAVGVGAGVIDGLSKGHTGATFVTNTVSAASVGFYAGAMASQSSNFGNPALVFGSAVTASSALGYMAFSEREMRAANIQRQ